MTDVPDPELELKRLDLRSADVIEPRVEALAALFPEAVEDGKLGVDAMRSALGDIADEGPERFGLTWPGKADAIRMAQRRSEGTLVPMKDESVDWETTKNVIIEGENLEVLKLLQRSYHAKVKLIYIDPPYNTGRDFVYPDNFKDPLDEYLRYSGQIGEDGARLRANTETGGRYHSAWLSMMWPRLHLARSLLRNDGFIVVSIDDVEATRLRLILDEVFGEENFVAQFIRRSMHTVRNSSRDVSTNHDYALCFARDLSWHHADPSHYIRHRLDKSGDYRSDDDDGRGPYKLDPLSARNYMRPYTYVFNNSVEWSAPAGSYPRYSEDSLKAMEDRGDIVFTGKSPMAKRFLRDVQDGQPPDTILRSEVVGFNADGTSELKALFDGDAVFDQPKPTGLTQFLTEVLAATPDATVLDFFAGSGTLGHGTLRANAEDGGTRRYVMSQLPETTDYADNELRSRLPTISAITRERMRRVAADMADLIDLDLGFRAYALDTSALSPRRAGNEESPAGLLFADPVAPERTDEALLVELLLARGFDLTEQVIWHEVEGASVADVADGALLACFTRELTLELFEALVELEPAQLILLEAGFGDKDEVKINALQHLKTKNAHRQTPIELLVV